MDGGRGGVDRAPFKRSHWLDSRNEVAEDDGSTEEDGSANSQGQ
jgi:hypothetical protein